LFNVLTVAEPVVILPLGGFCKHIVGNSDEFELLVTVRVVVHVRVVLPDATSVGAFQFFSRGISGGTEDVIEVRRHYCLALQPVRV
jgi:hypothetical protein